MRSTEDKAGSKTRNLMHNHPLMRKCAVHEKPGKTKRRQQKLALRREWPVQIAFFLALFEQAIYAVFAGLLPMPSKRLT